MFRPLVIGHACAAGEAPANTLAGVGSALSAGADAMEIDVQLSADGVPVLMHDETVDRTTNLQGRVRELPLAALLGADAGDGEPVPTLDQVFDLVAGRLTVMCELKATPGEPVYDQRLVDAVLGVIASHGARAWAAIHSFNPDMVQRARATDRAVSAAIISVPLEGDQMARVRDSIFARNGQADFTVPVESVQIGSLLDAVLDRNGQAISVEHHCVTPELVRVAKQRQVTIWAWTADREHHWERLVAAGVDGIITNVPHKLRAYLSR